jgi:ferredoxin/flavodoxin---NADP+ reductase
MTEKNIQLFKGFTKVISKHHFAADTVLLRTERKDLIFKAGQHLVAGVGKYRREYSIFSGEGDPFIDLLIKVVPFGNVSIELSEVIAGQDVYIEGPYGSFTIDEIISENKKFAFIATGTGIAPFHSIVKSLPNLDYKILHGIRYHTETFGVESFDLKRYISCTSRDQQGNFTGKVTEYLQKNGVWKDHIYYLCGNGAMIYDVNEILLNNGISPGDIKTEVYF